MNATKQSFLAELRKALEAKDYPWLIAPSRDSPSMTGLDYMLRQMAVTITTERNHVMIDGPGSVSVLEAWKAIGMKGKPTYKGLRALPAE